MGHDGQGEIGVHDFGAPPRQDRTVGAIDLDLGAVEQDVLGVPNVVERRLDLTGARRRPLADVAQGVTSFRQRLMSSDE